MQIIHVQRGEGEESIINSMSEDYPMAYSNAETSFQRSFGSESESQAREAAHEAKRAAAEFDESGFDESKAEAGRPEARLGERAKSGPEARAAESRCPARRHAGRAGRTLRRG